MFAINQVPIRHGRLADVGTGAGFPAVPISMAVPDLHCVLIESNQKKATFLAELVRTLNLDHVEVYRGRMESFDSSSERFDFTISRALGMHLDFLQWSCIHLSAYGSAVLWISDADAVQISKTLPWNWRKPAPIPDSQHRVLLIGS
jgi:16S rRNA (guanine527-N7)-methyltransferase